MALYLPCNLINLEEVDPTKGEICIVIPARFKALRLEGKVLMDIGGKSMLQRVYEQCSLCLRANKVIVATDHPAIFDHCTTMGYNIMMTSPDHPSGTDRVAEIANATEYEVYINVQGDEPMINPLQIDDLIQNFADAEVDIATQYLTISDPYELFDFNTVKVVVNSKSDALYFSRQCLPASRDLPFRAWFTEHSFKKHVGIYGFRKQTLLELSQLQPSPLEKMERLEQLRWLENGYSIRCTETKYQSIGVDTQDDLEKVRSLISKLK